MRLVMVAMMLATVPAMAQEPGKLRDLCTDRPGLNSPPCTVDQGHLQVEVGLGDWTLDKQPDERTDHIVAGDILLRYGVGPSTELRANWESWGHDRVRDRTSGMVDKVSGIGDLTLALRQNLRHPDGNGFALAVQPYVSVPVGRNRIGAGDWGTGLLVPVNYSISDVVTFELTPEVDAAVDDDGHGRHLAYGSAAGVQFKLGKTILGVEFQALRDRDPEEHSTQAQAGLSLAYQPDDNLQFDVAGYHALNHKSPDVEIAFGVVRRF